MKKKDDPCAPSDFRFEKDGNSFLVAGPCGPIVRLTAAELRRFASGGVKPGSALFRKLGPAGLLRGYMDLDRIAREEASLSAGISRGPSLHILVLTLECNHACVYCRAVPASGRGAMMSRSTALKSVDTAFCSPNESITIEFQGGEPLLNWPVLKEASLHARRRARAKGKRLALSVVTNLSLMDERKFAFLRAQGISVCTSLDGPAALHDANRKWAGGSSHARAVYWLRRGLSAAAKDGGKDSLPSALMTATRAALAMPREIVEEYRALGLGGIFLRPLSPIGYAGRAWDAIGYGPEEFLRFYGEALGHIMQINLAGERFVERNAALLARKLLRAEDPGYLDLRSPCGAAIGQLAYNYNGDVYTCDEGRMVAACGDDFFRLGNVRASRFGDLMTAPAARVCALASCLEAQPYCARCAFRRFCGVCPVHNYCAQGSPWGDIRSGSWCALQKGLFKAVLRLLENGRTRRVVEGWLDPR